MSITEQGLSGERLARELIKAKWKPDNIFQLDWLLRKGDKYYAVEVKHKEPFKPPPFMGQGLDIRQVKARQKLYEDTGIRYIFLVFDMEGRAHWAWLDELERTKYQDTKNGKIRVYDLKKFHKVNYEVERE